jgi:hypothetical protein
MVTERIASRTGFASTAVAVVVALAFALTVAGCSAPPSPGAPVNTGVSQVPTVSPSAASTATGAQSAHRGAVSADTYTAIVKAMKAAGMRMTDETGLLMTYGNDQQHVMVQGSMMTSGRGGMMGGSPRSTGSVVMVFTGGSWTVSAVK